MEQSLSCHTVGNEPHAQEKQKEENILHLQNRGGGEKRRGSDCDSIVKEQKSFRMNTAQIFLFLRKLVEVKEVE